MERLSNVQAFSEGDYLFVVKGLCSNDTGTAIYRRQEFSGLSPHIIGMAKDASFLAYLEAAQNKLRSLIK